MAPSVIRRNLLQHVRRAIDFLRQKITYLVKKLPMVMNWKCTPEDAKINNSKYNWILLL